MLLLAITMHPMNRFVRIVTGSEMTSMSCITQGIPNMVIWKKQKNQSFPIEVTTDYMTLSNGAISTLSITNIKNVSIGGMYRCVAFFGGQSVPSSFALLTVTGMCFLS